MPFHFKMQKVLDYREQLEEEAKIDLAQKEQKLQTACVRFDNLKLELRSAEDRLSEAALRSAAEGWLQQQYVKGLRNDVAEAAMQTRMLRQLVDEARKLLSERAIDRKLLDKLKERQKNTFLHDAYLKEQRINDETATLRYKATSL
ncbi:MAG: flagellar export protein FliJ [Desulfovibrio sp.]|nr:flagellar export protein FliJ [Desulfovibrio sp.]